MLTNTKEYIFEIDCTGETALHWACKRGIILNVKNIKRV